MSVVQIHLTLATLQSFAARDRPATRWFYKTQHRVFKFILSLNGSIVEIDRETENDQISDL